MTGSVVLDLLLILLLIAYAVFGFRRGFILSLGSFAGIVVGALAAFFAIPLVTAWVTTSQFRLPVILVVVVALVALGQAAGSALGRVIRRRVDKSPLRAIDRVFGAAITLVGAALVVSMLAFGLGSLGVPVVSQAIGSSTVVSTIDRVTPDPVKALEARVRSLFALDGLPRLFEALGTGTPLPVPTAGQTAAQQVSARSVVKITGNAYQCGQNQSGSGFVSSSGRVVTNAHVVAGVTQPVILTPAGATYTGRVVYFNAAQDLAVIAVNGLPTAPLPLGADLTTGATAVFDGYPLGGPFLSSPAAVQNVATINSPDIYGANPRPREVYYLAADVQEGNSGGPLIDAAGSVTGVIFARSATTSHLGFAMTTQELAPVVAQAQGLSASVSSGNCTRG
ncbi:MarP family serine protease [Lacisediminihabitans sp. FW035]